MKEIKKIKNKNIILALGLIIVIILYSSLYIVTEGQQALVLRLGKIIAVTKTPGLYAKWPFLESTMLFDTRLQTLSVDSSRILTQEQKYVLVDYYAKWQIIDLPLYFTRTGGDVDQSRILLKQKINDSLRAEFGRLNLSQVISDSRAQIMQQLQIEANEGAKKLGIEVLDVRIKKIDLPKEVSISVFNSMSASREAAAAKYRFDGKAAAEKIQAEADADAAVITATAQDQAAMVRASGDAGAAKIYSDAYGKDEKFYEFIRSLEAYKNIFNPKNSPSILVLKPDSQFFKFFNNNGVNHTNG